jgi:ribosomal protein S6--L-glutamate ligase
MDQIQEKNKGNNKKSGDNNRISTKDSKTVYDVVILTSSTKDSPSPVADMFLKECDSMGINCNIVSVDTSWISETDIEKGTIKISNIDGNDTELVVKPLNTVCIVRAGAIANDIGIALTQSFEMSGAFMINHISSMITCSNKMSSYLAFNRDNINIPRTAILSNEKSIDFAHQSIGGKFPVVIKTLTGTQGIGVSIVDSMQSLISVVQSLWKYGAHLIIQEFIELKYDVRTLVMNNKILASTKRNKPKKDFRSNKHRGATTEPYRLSDVEEEAVLAAVRAVGSPFLCGVDHVVDGKDIKILEVNGSPGMESSFSLYDVSEFESEDNEFKGKTTSKKIVKSILNHLMDEKHRRKHFHIESGYVETLYLIPKGSPSKESIAIRAKMDTGNGTWASLLQCDKYQIIGDKYVKWELFGKIYKNELMGWSKPQHIIKFDERPIIHIDLMFNNKLYKDVPIGLSTERSRTLMLVNRDLLTRFNVNVNPNKRFALSDWSPRNLLDDENDGDRDSDDGDDDDKSILSKS